MEINFQNKREDRDAFYSYMLKETPEGIRLGKQGYKNQQIWTLLWVAVFSALFWGLFKDPGFAFFLGVACFLLAEGVNLIMTGFKPYYSSGLRIYKNQEKYLTEKDLQIFQLQKVLVTDDKWLEIRSSEAVHRWRWRRVDRIGITSDFIFIHVGACPVVYIPKRDFPSEQSFIECGKSLVEQQEKYKGQPIGAE